MAMNSDLLWPEPAQANKFFEQKLKFTAGPVEVNHMLEESEDIVVVDVRAREHFQEGHIPGAVNLPKAQWATASGLDKNRRNVLYCYTQQCHLAAMAAYEFSQAGFPVVEMEGGFAAWADNQLPIEKGDQKGGQKRADNKTTQSQAAH